MRASSAPRTPAEALAEAERRLAELAAERDELRERLKARERELIVAGQREWSEQQQRIEAQREAAAARELAAGQVAELRQRLALAEAELANAAAERDRAQELVRRAEARRQEAEGRLSAEAARREAAEARVEELQAELESRSRLAARAGRTLGAARRRLAREREQRVDLEELERRLRAERTAFAEHVAGLERAVETVRERLAAAARALHGRLAEERAARIAAEAELAVEREGARRARMEAAWLEGELARAREGEARLRAALDALRAELRTVRGADAELRRRLAERIDAVHAVARSLRDGVAEAPDVERRELGAALASLQGRLAELRAQVLRTEETVQGELEAERQARAAAEARVRELEAELRELRGDAPAPAGLPAAETLASLREALVRLGRAKAGAGESALAEDLAAAAARLRSAAARQRGQVEGEAGTTDAEARPAEQVAEAGRPSVAQAVEPERPAQVEEAEPAAPADEPRSEPEVREATTPEPRPEPETEQPDAAAEVERPGAEQGPRPEPEAKQPQAGAGVEHAGTQAEAGKPAEPAPAPERVAPAAAPARQPGEEKAEPERRTLPARGVVRPVRPWLRDAVLALADEEPAIAELVVVALLGAQAGTVRRPVTYDLIVTDGGRHRVELRPDSVNVSTLDGEPGPVRVEGPVAALVPLATGGAGWRLRGAKVHGRRHLRRLLRERRAPLSLDALARARVTIAPGLLLTLLAGRVPADWTAGEALSVDVAVEGADRWRVATGRDGGLTVEPAGEEAPEATLHVGADRLAAVLAGTAPAEVEGDRRAVRKLLTWLDRVQRAER